MCIVLPVTHLVCTHTETIWQHCIEATKSEVRGVEPCGHEREHARPIMTRKPCLECGGQRYFARRGGIAERGSGTEVSLLEMLGQKDFSVKMLGKREDYADPNDSGYHSEVTLEEHDSEVDEDFPLSPKTSPATSMRLKRARKHSNLNRGFQTPRSAPSSEGSWSPNLKKELQEQTISSPTTNPIPRTMQSVPRLRHPRPPPRKGSTLLHPSPPVDPTSTSTSTPPAHYLLSLPRKGSTLLHPSSPPETPIPYRAPTPFPLSATNKEMFILTPPTTPVPAIRRKATPFPLLPAPVFSPPLSSAIRQTLSSTNLLSDFEAAEMDMDMDIDMGVDGDVQMDINIGLEVGIDLGPPTTLHSSYSDVENEADIESFGNTPTASCHVGRVDTPYRSYFDWDDSDDDDDDCEEESTTTAGLEGNGSPIVSPVSPLLSPILSPSVSKSLNIILARTGKVARASRISYPYHGRAPQGFVPR